jgi:hypothetical protein
LDHIELMPFTISQIHLPGYVYFVLLRGDRLYTAAGMTLYVYSAKELTHPIATYPINCSVRSALIVENRLYIGSTC